MCRQTQLQKAIRRNRADEPIILPGIESGVGVLQFSMLATEDKPYLSFATMLAPSPDWIAGVAGASLLKDGTVVDELHLPIWIWDAGVDSRLDFYTPDAPNQPKETVRLLTHPNFLNPTGLMPLGWVTITLHEP